MASDWIKLRVDIFRDPSVLRMSDICRTNRHQIVGQLSDVWGWIDGHTVDGSCPNISITMLDAYIGVDGFGAAMREVGWLEEHNGGVRLPKWDRHNSVTAKARSLENEAKRLRRTSVGQVSDKTSDKTSTKRPTREEKRREEKSISPPPPKGGGARIGAPAGAREEIDDAWISSLASDPTYTGIDIRKELGKCRAWCATNRKVCSRRRFTNWINRADAPLLGRATATTSFQPPRQHDSI